MTVDLFYRVKGEGPALLLLHGLFGSGDNLGGIIRSFSNDFTTYALDLRCHGRSPHAEHISYPLMADDVIRFMDKEGIETAHFFGHSMGGKAAMQIALSHSDRVEKLVVADIAPVAYESHHGMIFKGMQAVQAASPDSRKEAEDILTKFEGESAVVSFLLTNWRRQENGNWGWRLDFDTIQRDYDNITGAVSGTPYLGDTLFLRGGLSDYILSEYRDAILTLFPKATVRTIEGTGHWLHAEKTDMVSRTIQKFFMA